MGHFAHFASFGAESRPSPEPWGRITALPGGLGQHLGPPSGRISARVLIGRGFVPQGKWRISSSLDLTFSSMREAIVEIKKKGNHQKRKKERKTTFLGCLIGPTGLKQKYQSGVGSSLPFSSLPLSLSLSPPLFSSHSHLFISFPPSVGGACVCAPVCAPVSVSPPSSSHAASHEAGRRPAACRRCGRRKRKWSRAAEEEATRCARWRAVSSSSRHSRRSSHRPALRGQ